jgi:hypothetical protein
LEIKQTDNGLFDVVINEETGWAIILIVYASSEEIVIPATIEVGGNTYNVWGVAWEAFNSSFCRSLSSPGRGGQN